MPMLLRVILFLFCFSLSFSQIAGTAEPFKKIRLAVIPCNEPVKAFEQFLPLARYLEKKTGLTIELEVASNCKDLARRVQNKEADMVFQTASNYLQLAESYNRDHLLKFLTIDGDDHLYGVVVVRQDSGIKQLSDLRGKVVQFGPEGSLQKWIAARWLFAESGIDIERDLSRNSIKGGCCDEIAFNVFIKKVDAGIVCEHAMDKIGQKGNLNIHKFREIARTSLVPSHVFAARKEIPEKVITAVTSALLELDKGNPEYAPILHRAEIGGFRRTSDDHYDELRKMAAAANDTSPITCE
ncbi:MAG: phosphate/phosphite/phosphonate ABC transporter substrate-binding protein [Thermodesulfobacteriota bacterium]